MKIQKIAVGLIRFCCVACFLALTLTMVLMIASRNVPFIQFDVMWTDEIGRYLMVYLVFLGSGLAMIEGKHMRVEFILDKLSPGARRVAELFNDVCTIIFCAIMTVGGLILVKSTGTQAVATLRKYFEMPMAWWNSAVMVGGFIMLAAACLIFVRRLRNQDGGKPDDPDGGAQEPGGLAGERG